MDCSTSSFFSSTLIPSPTTHPSSTSQDLLLLLTIVHHDYGAAIKHPTPKTNLFTSHTFRSSRFHCKSFTKKRTAAAHPTINKLSFEQRMLEALQVIDHMKQRGSMHPDPSFYCMLLKSCADNQELEMGIKIHNHAMIHKLESDVFVANNLITMYAKCEKLEIARRVFDEMPNRNFVTWTSMISACSQLGHHTEALKLYDRMRGDSGIKANGMTYAVALRSCANTRDLKRGSRIHRDLVEEGCELDIYVRVALIDMYSKCKDMDRAREVFEGIGEPSAIAYTAIIEGYNLNYQPDEAVWLIRRLLRSGVDENFMKEMSFPCMIRSCGMIMGWRQAQEIHAYLIKSANPSGRLVAKGLVELYLKCGKVKCAVSLFSSMVDKPGDLWQYLVSVCVRDGFNLEALMLFSKMLREDVNSGFAVLSEIHRACLALSAVEDAKQIRAIAVKSGHEFRDV